MLDPRGELCRCGSRGCLTLSVGALHLLRRAEEFSGHPVSIDEFIEHARAGHIGYRRFVEDAADIAGWGMGLTATILNPPLFVIAGKFAMVGDFFVERLQKSFGRHTLPQMEIQGKGRTRFVVGKFLGNDDTVLVAVALVLHQHGKVTTPIG